MIQQDEPKQNNMTPSVQNYKSATKSSVSPVNSTEALYNSKKIGQIKQSINQPIKTIYSGYHIYKCLMFIWYIYIHIHKASNILAYY